MSGLYVQNVKTLIFDIIMNKSKKIVLFKSYGSEKDGLGHVSRCIALINAVPSEWCSILMVNANKFLAQYLLKFNIVFTHDFPDNDVDIIIIDQWKKEKGLTEKLKKTYNCHVVRLDYYNYTNSYIDTIINLFNHSNENPFQGGKIKNYYEGLEFAIIAPRFHKYLNKKESIKNIDRIIIIMGGADPGLKTCDALKFLSNISRRLHIDIIVGPLCPFEDVINKQTLQCPHKTNIYKTPDNLPALMANAHLAISGCGTTFFELSFLGTPAIVMAQNQMEHRFCEFLENERLACIARKNFNEAWHVMNNEEKRKQFIKRQMNVFDANGTYRILTKAGIIKNE